MSSTKRARDVNQGHYAWIATVVRVEMAIAGLLMVLGLVTAWVRDADYRELSHVLISGELVRRLLGGDGIAMVYAGILVLLLIPVSALLLALWSFVLRRDYRFAGATLLVVLLVILGVIVGH